MERVLVTGANGLLGANIVAQLNSMNFRVRILVRKGSNRISLKGLDFEVFEGEITCKEDVFHAVSGCDYVIHSAARTAQSPSDLEAYREVNINATRLLMDAAKHGKVKRFVFVSTANSFTNGSLTNPGNENSGFMPWLKKSGYAYSKYLAQMEVIKQAKEKGFPAVVVSPTFMIGPRDAKPSSGRLILHGHKNRIVFYPPGGKSFVDVEAAAEAACRALTQGKIGESYLLAGTNMTYRDFFNLISQVTGKKKVLIPIPQWLLTFNGYLSTVLHKLFSISLPLNVTNARLLGLDNYFSNAKAVSELGMRQTDLKNSVTRAINWFEKNNIS